MLVGIGGMQELGLQTLQLEKIHLSLTAASVNYLVTVTDDRLITIRIALCKPDY